MLTVVILLALWLLISGIMYYSVMRKHIYTFENSKDLPSYSEYEKEGLIREKSGFTSSRGKKLCGYFYWRGDRSDYKGVIIVNNGFGSGHEGMLSEISELTR